MANDPSFHVAFVEAPGLPDPETQQELDGLTVPHITIHLSGAVTDGATIYYNDPERISNFGDTLQATIQHEIGHAYEIYINANNAAEFYGLLFETALDGYGIYSGACYAACGSNIPFYTQ